MEATFSRTSLPSRACATQRQASCSCSIGWACLSTAPPRGSSISAVSVVALPSYRLRRRDDRAATLYALDEQVRRYETVDVEDEHGVCDPRRKMVQKLESWDYLSSVLGDDGTASASSRKT